MRPTLVPGDQVLVDPKAFRHRRPTPGDVVVAEHPFQPGLVLIKRLVRLEDTGVVLVGDNPAATTDSRDFGPIPLDRLMGRVVCTL